MMVIVDGGSSYEYGAYLPDKSNATTISTFDTFHTKAETLTRKKVHQLRTDWAYDLVAGEKYCQTHGIIHKLTALHSSAQNGLAEHVIRTTIYNVQTLLHDSNLSHSYWAEAVAYSINTHNLIPSQQHPSCILTESFSGKRQNILYLYVFGAKCWAKILTAHGGSKLDPRSTECCFLGYAPGSSNYKVQDITSCWVFVLCNVIFEEGQPCHTSAGVRERKEPMFDMELDTNKVQGPPPTDNFRHHVPDQTDPNQTDLDHIGHQRDIPDLHQSSLMTHPSNVRI